MKEALIEKNSLTFFDEMVRELRDIRTENEKLKIENKLLKALSGSQYNGHIVRS